MTDHKPNQPSHRAVVNIAKEGAEKGFYREIGAAWAHENGKGFTLHLDLMPAQGQDILLFINTPKEAA